MITCVIHLDGEGKHWFFRGSQLAQLLFTLYQTIQYIYYEDTLTLHIQAEMGSKMQDSAVQL